MMNPNTQSLPELMRRVEFDRIGEFVGEKPDYMRFIKSLGLLDSSGFDDGYRTRGAGLSKGPCSFGDDTTRGGGLSRGGPASFGSLSFESPAPVIKSPAKPKKPEGIEQLETLLSTAYSADVKITRVRKLPPTRKQEVKEISYLTGDGIVYKVWMFKADPVNTLRELKIYHIASQAGVQTASPVGFIPAADSEQYPYDIAILGGMLNHAGGSYRGLIEQLELSPDTVFKTAVKIAEMIADFHVKLTDVQEEFGKYGIAIPHFKASHEIWNRVFKAWDINEDDPRKGNHAQAIARCFDSLEGIYHGIRVISHNDIHTGNVVTQVSDINGVSFPCYDRFGVIDWGDIALDNPYGDLRDFWTHHQRLALEVCGEYNHGFEEFEEAYALAYNQKKGEHNASFVPQDCRVVSVCKSALWNLLEMYDPVRKDPNDIRAKAEMHCRALMSDLNQIGLYGYPSAAGTIRLGLREVLEEVEYLKPIL